ncbi:quinone-dependent dihydroorotate dehydrogenase, partial [bacterium]|nr:quinone-dependent dihydroorotate dehydrogenase [bacterium]
AIHGLASLGFSQIEIGAVTPRAQPGNPAPRLFRYPAEQALINRMGFNNDGMDAIRDRLTAALRDRNDFDRCVLGVNLGKNKDTPAEGALDDFLKVHDSLKDVARFFVMNLSSPNTPGLRDLARPDFLRQAAVGYGPDIKRVWIKFDPDMEKARFQELINEVGRSGFAGVVLTNTHRVEKPEAGGLSGRPVARLSNRMLEWAWEVHRGALPMIGVGGIMTGRDVLDKIMRGAFAVQIYTAFIYRGPLVVTQLLREFEMEMRQHGFDTVAGAIGTYYNPITRGSNTHPSPGSNLPGTSK